MRALLVLIILTVQVFAQATAPERLPLDNVDEKTATTIRTMRTRRVRAFAAAVSDSYVYANPNNIQSWIQTLGPTGRWPDSSIDYTSKCNAQRANWPAAVHWHRLYIMTAAWHKSLPASAAKNITAWAGDAKLREAIGRGMTWWFNHDFQTEACLDSGGLEACPCNTPGLWNPNWFANIIYVPRLISRVCSFLADSHAMNLNQTMECVKPMRRAFFTFHMDHVNGLGPITGANAVDIASIGVDAAILSANTTMLDEAYKFAHRELVIKDQVGEDGIRTDGGFAQHQGVLLYNGNYGKDFVNAAVAIELAAVGTSWTANADQKQALATLFDGDRWMIFRNTRTGVLHWDFSTLNRFITFPVSDDQATSDIHINLTQVGTLGTAWSSRPISLFASTLVGEDNSANAGKVNGTRVFWNNDYVVNRGPNYVTSLKMYSTRTQNSECVNNQNPFGFHLSDGAMYTYAYGSEYEDIFAAWNWVLIPGTTTFPGQTTFDCSQSSYSGKSPFVGGASDGQSGIAAMKYQHPEDAKLGWQKTWFFLADNIQIVMINQITAGAGAVTVLDQKRRLGDVAIDGVVTEPGEQRPEEISTLWHGRVGYSFMLQDSKPEIVIQTAPGHGSWNAIGTSTKGKQSVELFTSYVEHDTTDFMYAIFPGVDLPTFKTTAADLKVLTIQNNGSASAMYYVKRNQIFAVFWDAGTLNTTPLPQGYAQRQLTISSDSPIVLLYDIDNDKITVADPTQKLASVKITLATPGSSHVFEIKLPGGGSAGSSVTQLAGRAITQAQPQASTGPNSARRSTGEFIPLSFVSFLSLILSFLIFL